MGHDFHEVATTITLLLLFLYFLLRWKHKTNTKTRSSPPEPSGSWPLIGHLHLLGGVAHLAMGKLADEYGPIFMMRIGVHRALVVSSYEMANECLGINDKAFLGRSKTIFVEHLGYDSAMLGFIPYGAYWRGVRKIVTHELLSNQRVETSSHVRTWEVRMAIKAVRDEVTKASKGGSCLLVDMKQWMIEVNLNTMVRLVAGKSLKEVYQGEEYNEWKKAIRVWFDLAGVFVPADALPVLRWLDIGGYEKSMIKYAQVIDHLHQTWLDEHRRKRGSGSQQQDFMDVMLAIFEKGEQDMMPSGFDQDTVIKATCMNMILGGTDTAAVTSIWALSLLLNNQDALKKAQAEIDAHVGKQRLVNESDLENLTYLQAIIKETLRLYPAVPLVPRESITDCTVGGYHIPGGTRLFVNVSKIHRDPRIWSDPLEFRPERFLTTDHKDVDVRGQHFELMPFGAGRRICPGISFAMQSMQFTLASLLHGFEISTPGGEKVDMTEGSGLTNMKVSPLEVMLRPRLPDNLY